MNRHPVIGRRQFLRIVAVGGMAGVAWGVGLRMRSEDTTVSEARNLLGTVVNLTVIGPDRQAAQAAVQDCLDHMQGLESILSRFQPTSQLSQLNRSGRLEGASPHLLSVLEEARRISAASGGAFDVTVKPIVDLYQSYQAANRGLPPRDAIQALLPLVDFEGVVVTGDRVVLATKDMAITLDGIAKGYIVDQGISALRQHGFGNVLVEAGGDLMASGHKAGQQPWTIGIEAPRPAADRIRARFGLQDMAAATSGDYMQFFATDYSEYHILDPHSGYSPDELASATILAPDATRADALATAVMVLGTEAGLRLIQQLPGYETYLVTKDMQTHKSAGFTLMP